MADFELVEATDAEVRVKHLASGFDYVFPYLEEYGRKVLSKDGRLEHDLSAQPEAFEHTSAAHEFALDAAIHDQVAATSTSAVTDE